MRASRLQGAHQPRRSEAALASWGPDSSQWSALPLRPPPPGRCCRCYRCSTDSKVPGPRPASGLRTEATDTSPASPEALESIGPGPGCREPDPWWCDEWLPGGSVPLARAGRACEGSGGFVGKGCAVGRGGRGWGGRARGASQGRRSEPKPAAGF